MSAIFCVSSATAAARVRRQQTKDDSCTRFGTRASMACLPRGAGGRLSWSSSRAAASGQHTLHLCRPRVAREPLKISQQLLPPLLQPLPAVHQLQAEVLQDAQLKSCGLGHNSLDKEQLHGRVVQSPTLSTRYGRSTLDGAAWAEEQGSIMP
jgi:hypothetical protein